MWKTGAFLKVMKSTFEKMKRTFDEWRTRLFREGNLSNDCDARFKAKKINNEFRKCGWQNLSISLLAKSPIPESLLKHPGDRLIA